MDKMKIIKKLFLQKLIRSNAWGGKHTPVSFIIKGIPEHFRNTHKGKRSIEKTLNELVNYGWIIITSKKTGKGSDDHISLNPRKVSEIKKFLADYASRE